MRTMMKNLKTKEEKEITRQERIVENKRKHGFNTVNLNEEVRYLLGEVTEVMEAIEKGDKENLLEELADVVIYAYGMAEIGKVGNLDEAIERKMCINEKREYKKDERGRFIKVVNGAL